MRNLKRVLNEIEKNPVDRHEPLLEYGTIASLKDSENFLGFSTVRIYKRIGLGTHAEVYEACPVEVSLPSFALKVEKPLKHSSGFLGKEGKLLESLSGSGIAPEYIGKFNVSIGDVECLGVGMELFDDSLSSLKSFRNTLTLEVLDWLLVQMFECIFRIHQLGYLHRDIKPSNFMYKASPEGVRVSLVDFGSAIRLGEKTLTPFRGTGAYLGLSCDPMESKPLDDYWSTAFSLLELAIEGGLSWRSISARSEDGRAEILKQKKGLLSNIFEGNMSSCISPLFGNTLALLFQSSSDSFQTQFRELVSDTPVKASLHAITNCLRPPTCWRLEGPKEMKNFQSILLDKSNRESLASISSRCYPFRALDPYNPIHNGILSVLSAIGQQASQDTDFLCFLNYEVVHAHYANAP